MYTLLPVFIHACMMLMTFFHTSRKRNNILKGPKKGYEEERGGRRKGNVFINIIQARRRSIIMLSTI